MSILQSWLVVVPARLASTRLPRKPLQDLGGKALIVRVVENLQPLAKEGARIVVAVDDPEVESVVRAAGFAAVMTRVSHQSGSDRCAEVAEHHEAAFVLNVQGDEPFVRTDDLKRLMLQFEKSSASMGSLFVTRQDADGFRDANLVKVVVGDKLRALYFSRAPVPYPRDGGAHVSWKQHIGVYAFRREALVKFVSMPMGISEGIEKLEQLRALEHGMEIFMFEVDEASIGIDTPHDLEAARARF